MPSALARLSVSAVDGAVVSKPIAKNTTSRSGFCAGDPQRVERRVDHPHVGARRPWPRAALPLEPGTRIMSPKQVKITPGWCAIAIPSSTRPIGITHTGQPGRARARRWPAADRRSRTCRSSGCGRRRPPSPCSGAPGSTSRGSRRPARGRARRRGTRRRTSCRHPAARFRRGPAAVPSRHRLDERGSRRSWCRPASFRAQGQRARSSTRDAHRDAVVAAGDAMLAAANRRRELRRGRGHSITLAFSSSSSCS